MAAVEVDGIELVDDGISGAPSLELTNLTFASDSKLDAFNGGTDVKMVDADSNDATYQAVTSGITAINPASDSPIDYIDYSSTGGVGYWAWIKIDGAYPPELNPTVAVTASPDMLNYNTWSLTNQASLFEENGNVQMSGGTGPIDNIWIYRWTPTNRNILATSSISSSIYASSANPTSNYIKIVYRDGIEQQVFTTSPGGSSQTITATVGDNPNIELTFATPNPDLKYFTSGDIVGIDVSPSETSSTFSLVGGFWSNPSGEADYFTGGWFSAYWGTAQSSSRITMNLSVSYKIESLTTLRIPDRVYTGTSEYAEVEAYTSDGTKAFVRSGGYWYYTLDNVSELNGFEFDINYL